MSAYSIALSGLIAQSSILAARAQNIAGSSVTGKLNPSTGDRRAYAPVDAVTVSTTGGGVAAEIVPVEPSSVALYDPDSLDSDADGMIAAPNVSLEEEIVGLNVAKNAYITNAKTISVQRDMDDALMDIIT